MVRNAILLQMSGWFRKTTVTTELSVYVKGYFERGTLFLYGACVSTLFYGKLDMYYYEYIFRSGEKI